MKPEEAIPKVNAIKMFLGYEDTPVIKSAVEAITMAIEALEKQIPKKPEQTVERFKCPNCGGWAGFSTYRHCMSCGQKIDWSDSE